MQVVEDYRITQEKILRCEAALAEQKRAYFVDGIRSDMRARVALEAELADLRLKRHSMKSELLKQKTEIKQEKEKVFLLGLIRRCEAAGLAAIVEEAQAESLAWVKDRGLYQAYAANF